jgi:hypothetical protein
VDPNEVLSPQWRRRIGFTDDVLTLTSFDEQQQITAVSTWRRN